MLCLIATAMCSCTAEDRPTDTKPAAQATAPATSDPVEIYQVSAADTGGDSSPSGFPSFKPALKATEPLDGSVTLSGDSTARRSVSVRLVDLSQGKVAGEQMLVFEAGQSTATYEFKPPAEGWTEGRHLIETRVGRTGKVVTRELDIASSAPPAKPSASS